MGFKFGTALIRTEFWRVAFVHRSIGLSVKGGQRTRLPRQSATCHRLVACASYGAQGMVGALASQRTTGIPQPWLRQSWLALEFGLSMLASIEAVSVMACRHRPKSLKLLQNVAKQIQVV